MAEAYVSILKEAGGKMAFPDFVAACHQRGIDGRLWLRAKHAGVLFSYFENGVHVLSLTSPVKAVGNG
jgi:hypothetical protein